MVWLQWSPLFLTFCLCFLSWHGQTKVAFFSNATFGSLDLKHCSIQPRLLGQELSHYFVVILTRLPLPFYGGAIKQQTALFSE